MISGHFFTDYGVKVDEMSRRLDALEATIQAGSVQGDGEGDS